MTIAVDTALNPNNRPTNLLKLVEMLSGNAYFQCISKIFLTFALFFSLKVHFR